MDKNGNPLMPTKSSRARRMIRDGKAVGKRKKSFGNIVTKDNRTKKGKL
ncbi:MAG: RRXRR domain-containing protein [Prochloraceae cyanobacterium]